MKWQSSVFFVGQDVPTLSKCKTHLRTQQTTPPLICASIPVTRTRLQDTSFICSHTFVSITFTLPLITHTSDSEPMCLFMVPVMECAEVICLYAYLFHLIFQYLAEYLAFSNDCRNY